MCAAGTIALPPQTVLWRWTLHSVRSNPAGANTVSGVKLESWPAHSPRTSPTSVIEHHFLHITFGFMPTLSLCLVSSKLVPSTRLWEGSTTFKLSRRSSKLTVAKFSSWNMISEIVALTAPATRKGRVSGLTTDTHVHDERNTTAAFCKPRGEKKIASTFDRDVSTHNWLE